VQFQSEQAPSLEQIEPSLQPPVISTPPFNRFISPVDRLETVDLFKDNLFSNFCVFMVSPFHFICFFLFDHARELNKYCELPVHSYRDIMHYFSIEKTDLLLIYFGDENIFD